MDNTFIFYFAFYFILISLAKCDILFFIALSKSRPYLVSLNSVTFVFVPL